MRLWPICAIFFLSGVSGLIYQVVWVRSFGNVFGNTVYSSALVTSVFMFGLGCGSYVAGRLVDRKFVRNPQFPLRAYAFAELAIGALGYLIAVVLPHLERWSAMFSTYRRDPAGWYELSASSYLLRYALAVGLLFPPTLLMGATLTLLIRHLLSSNLAQAGRRTGLLYGVNTLGAACGCLLVDFKLIPLIGLQGTQEIAVFFNLLAGLSAWILLRRDSPHAVAEAPSVMPSTHSRTLTLATTLLFLTGFAGMGMEILWFRFLTSALGQFRSVFSLLLAVILVGIWLGSLMGGYCADKFRKPRLVFGIAVVAFGLATLASLALFDIATVFPADFVGTYYATDPSRRPVYELMVIVKAIAWLVGIPALCMGCTFPLANAIVQTEEGGIGRAAGTLYLGNTLGAVLGSLVMGFVLIPSMGMKWATLVCACTALLSVVPLTLINSSWILSTSRRALVGTGAAAITAALFAWSALPADRLLVRSFRDLAVRPYLKAPTLLRASEGLMETIAIVESPEISTGKRLYTNGHIMSSSAETGQRYMRALAHLPLIALDSPQSVLVICFGVGNTLNAASLHPSVTRLDIADLSRHVLEQADMFSDSNGNVLEDPRVSVFVNDGRQHLRMQPAGTYDVITLEPPPIAFAGVSSLYSVEFYEIAKAKLKPGGYLTQWLPIRQLPGQQSKSLVRAFVKTFPDSVLLAGEYGDFILMGRNGGSIEFDPAVVERRLAAAPAVRADLEKNLMGTPLDLAGLFLADGVTMTRVSRDVSPVTDDNPSMEYFGGILVVNSLVPAELIDTRSIRRWCPACFADGRPIPGLEPLDRYSGIMEAVFHDETFRYISLLGPAAMRARPIPMTREVFDDTVRQSPYLQRLMTPYRFAESDFAQP